jgi:hypothetical protein
MKVIIRLSGLNSGLEDTDQEQKPVQLQNRVEPQPKEEGV